MAPFFIGMALAEERKVDALAAGLLSVAAFMTVTPYSVGEAYAVGANWLGGANIIYRYWPGGGRNVYLYCPPQFGVIKLPDSVPASVSRSFLGINSRLYYSFRDGDYCLGVEYLGHQLPSNHYGYHLNPTGIVG